MSDQRSAAPAPPEYTNPYLAGLMLGIALLAAFVLVGRGLGASGAFTRTEAAALEVVAPDYAHEHVYWKKYTTGSKGPLDDFLIYQALGMILGGLVSASLAGRARREILRGPRISKRARLALALGGGAIAGFGARLAGGCTSGLALTGGATLSLAGWLFMFTFFAAGFAGAALVRRQWL